MNTTKRGINLQLNSSNNISDDQKAADDLNFAIGINRKILKLIGLWPYHEETIIQTIGNNFLTMFITIVIISFITIPQILALIKVWGNFDLVVDNLMLNIPSAISLLKIIVPWYNKKVLAEILVEIEKDWYEKRSANERDVMIKYATITRIVSIVGMCSAIISLITFYSPLIFDINLRTITNLTDKFERILPLQSVYFYEISTPRRYYLTYMGQIFALTCCMISYVGIDVLFGMAMLHCCGQCEILSNRIKFIAEENPENFQSLVKTHVENHYRQIRYVEIMKEMFSLLLLASFTTGAVITAVLEYQIICVFRESNDKIPVSKISFYFQDLLCATFLMFVYTSVGEHLIKQSESIHAAFYNCNWHCLDPRKSRQIILMLVGSQNPIQILAGNIIPVRLNSFSSLLKTSAGYVPFLLAVKK